MILLAWREVRGTLMRQRVPKLLTMLDPEHRTSFEVEKADHAGRLGDDTVCEILVPEDVMSGTGCD
ncbi:hypothetical protein ASG39_21785 [Rhizobium sp. Leaf371]|nr:hypothetical protein ASG39_21785 [Rhizobium sp. Leaf371]